MNPEVLTCVILAFFSTVQVSVGYMRVCYYTNWAQYRYGANFYPKDIPAYLCTHIFYAFAKIIDNDIRTIEWNDDDTPWSKGMYTKVNDLKQQNPALKTLISIGGWNDNLQLRTGEFIKTANSAKNRKTFVKNAIAFLRKRNFDGLDVDWEYPRPEDKHLELMKELSDGFREEGLLTKREPLLLTAAVWGNAVQSENCYNMKELGKYMDFVGIMSYDYYGSWGNVAMPHSMLYPDTDNAVQLWLRKGFPSQKLITGIATYGRSFTLTSSSNTPGSSSSGAGRGTFTNQRGFLSYYEICLNIKNNGWIEKWDAQRLVPYAFKGRDWVGYDNVASVIIKAKYIIKNKLGGAMIWDMDLDDFKNFCGQGKFPILNTIRNMLPSDGSSEVSNVNLDVNPDNANVDDGNPDDGTPDDGNPHDGTPDDGNPDDGNPDDGTLDGENVENKLTEDEAIMDGSIVNELSDEEIVDDGIIEDETIDNAFPSIDCKIADQGVPYPIAGNCLQYIMCANNIAWTQSCQPGLQFDQISKVCNWPFLVKDLRSDC